MYRFLSFYNEWWKLLTLTETYVEVLRKKFSHVIGFALLVALILALFRVPLWYMRVFPEWRLRLDETLAAAATNFPPDRSFEWTGTHFVTTPSEPLTVQFPQWWSYQAATSNVHPPTELAYIVPAATDSATLLTTVPGKPWFVATNQTLSVNNWMSEWDTVGWKEILYSVPPFTLTQASLQAQTPQILSAFDTAVKNSWPIFALALVIFSWLSLLFTILWEGLFVYLFLRLASIKLSFLSVLKITTYLVLAATTISTITTWIYPNLDPLWSTVALWAYFFVVLYSQNRALYEYGHNSK